MDNLFIHTMGRAFKVTAIFTNTADANTYMERNHDQCVIAVIKTNGKEYCFLSNVKDKGDKL